MTVRLPLPPLCWDGRYEPLHQKTVTYRGDIHTQRIIWWQQTLLIPKIEKSRAGEAAQHLGAFTAVQGTQVQFPDSHGWLLAIRGTPVPGNPAPSPGLRWHRACAWYSIHTQNQNSRQIKEKTDKNFKKELNM